MRVWPQPADSGSPISNTAGGEETSPQQSSCSTSICSSYVPVSTSGSAAATPANPPRPTKPIATPLAATISFTVRTCLITWHSSGSPRRTRICTSSSPASVEVRPWPTATRQGCRPRLHTERVWGNPCRATKGLPIAGHRESSLGHSSRKWGTPPPTSAAPPTPPTTTPKSTDKTSLGRTAPEFAATPDQHTHFRAAVTGLRLDFAPLGPGHPTTGGRGRSFVGRELSPVSNELPEAAR